VRLVDAEKQAARIKALGEWRPWFAWWPVTIRDSGDVVWLEPVERQTEFVSGYDGTYAFTYYRRSSPSSPPVTTEGE
jgi:hypothetical protein